MAGIGPMPMISGFTPAYAKALSSILGSMPSSSALSFVMSSAPAAPSLKPEELPAVTFPMTRKGVFSLPSPSMVVSGRGCSSLSATTQPSLVYTVMGTIISPILPDLMACSGLLLAMDGVLVRHFLGDFREHVVEVFRGFSHGHGA